MFEWPRAVVLCDSRTCAAVPDHGGGNIAWIYWGSSVCDKNCGREGHRHGFFPMAPHLLQVTWVLYTSLKSQSPFPSFVGAAKGAKGSVGVWGRMCSAIFSVFLCALKSVFMDGNLLEKIFVYAGGDVINIKPSLEKL